MKKSEGPHFEFSAIGRVLSPFTDKFGVPRQPGLASSAKGVLKFHNDPDLKTALRTMDQFSHLWIIFVFHLHGGKNWKPSIRPPRLGGTTKVGVLSSRSPHRPNPIGMSAVKILKVDLEAKGGPEIQVGGIDLLDGTPILDVKPYIPYADSLPDADAGWASAEIPRTPVLFSQQANETLGDDNKGLRPLIIEILEIDPRPAYQKTQHPPEDPNSWGRAYGFNFQNYDIQYEIQQSGFNILTIKALINCP